MVVWSARSTELANLLNPAFCGLLLMRAITGYQRLDPSGMPLSLCFLVLPLVLHQATREVLPRGIATTLLSWLNSRPEVRIGFDERSRSLVPFVREALSFLLSREQLTVSSDGRFTAVSVNINRLPNQTPEVTACFSKAEFIGRWFAQSGDESTIYSFFGIQP